MMFNQMKYCDTCGEQIKPDPRYSKKQWEGRKFCNRKCMGDGKAHDLAEILRTFESSYELDAKTGCWNWTKSKCEKGYGMFKIFKKGIRAHRASWYLHNKEMIPEGVLACHHCDNPSCVNPEHLFLGSPQDNVDDMRRKNRQRYIRGGQVHTATLNENQVRAIYLSDIPATKLAPVLDVCESTIRHIRQGKVWKHVTKGLQ